MPITREDDYNISETGNWNVAADYSKLKIMKPLYLCDNYENMAKFGYDSILDQLIGFNIPDEIIKLTGLERLVHELLRLITNCKFALRVKGTLDAAEKIEKKLKEIVKILPKLSRTISTRRGKMIKIDKESFDKVLDLVIEQKAKLNEPLNKNDLIFTHKEEFDPVKYKQDLIKNITLRG